MNWQDFLNIKPIKHHADLDIGDVVIVDDGNGGQRSEERTFSKAVADSYCGNDFSGYIEETGRRIGWRKNVDLYKIVGKQINASPVS